MRYDTDTRDYIAKSISREIISAVLIALFVMVTRRHAISQAAGFLMLDNGIAATAFLLTAGVPLIVELGASLDVLFAVIVIGVLTGRLRRAFGGADLDPLGLQPGDRVLTWSTSTPALDAS